jgi:branched-chain amino acid transport system permease protein
MIAQQLLNGIVVGSVYALFALGFTLIFSVNHILNMAHGAVFMAGAFIGLLCVTRLELPFPIALLVASIGSGCLNIILDRLAFRPLRRRRAPEFSAIISSVGAGLIIMSIAQRLSETRVLRYPFGTFPLYVIDAWGLRVTLMNLVIVATALLLFAALFFYLYRTRFGMQLRAVAVSERTASLLGVDSDLVYAQAFFISGAFAGIAGVLIGTAFNSVHFMMGEPFMLRAFVVIILGGLGSITGALVAGLLLGIVQTMTVVYLSAGLSDAIVFSILFLTLLFRPTGFFGRMRKERRVTRE